MGLAGFVVLFFVFNLWKNTLQSKVHKSFLNRAELGKIAPWRTNTPGSHPFPNQMTDLEATSKLQKQLALTCTSHDGGNISHKCKTNASSLKRTKEKAVSYFLSGI